MTKVDELPEDVRKDFCALIDEAILESGDDEELKEGFKALDEMAKIMNVSFYDLLLELYEESEIQARVDAWKQEKGL